MPIQQMLLGAGAAKAKTYIDDLFSTSLRTGNGGNKTIENSLDLSTEGGIVWVKERNSGNSHTLFATDMPDVSSKRPYLATNQDNLQRTKSNIDIAFYSNGYQIQGDDGQINQASGNTYVDWSIRKAPGFFDVVTYTGTGSARTVAHSLGCVPGSIWVKCLSESQSWSIYHRESNSSPEDYELRLDDTNAAYNYNSPWNSTLPTSTHFSLGTHSSQNGNGKSYIALIFAHDEQIFGESGDASVIKCDSWTGSGSAGLEVNVGFEPQWIIFKNASASYNWYVLDVMRGIISGGDDRILTANGDSQEWDSSYIDVTPTGFKLQTGHALGNASGNTYVYIAIRRPDGYVGKPPDAGTDVFAMDTGNSSSTIPAIDSGFPVDFALLKGPNTSGYDWYTGSRLMGSNYLWTNESDLQASSSNLVWDSNTGYYKNIPSTAQGWMWKRGKGFDCVTWSGNNASTRNINHSMNNIPEMIWVKLRTSTSGYNWAVYHKDVVVSPNFYELVLNNNEAQTDVNNFNGAFGGVPTSTYFTVKSGTMANGSGKTYIAMLFGSVDGISKVGSYTGTGSAVTVTTGFLPRLVIIKRADSGGNWVLLDSLRGLQTTSDSILRLNTDDAQYGSSDNVQTSSTGFTVPTGPGDFNNGDTSGKWIYYAHA